MQRATIKTFYTGHKNDKMASDQIKISTENDKSYGTTTVKPAAKTTEVEVKGIDRHWNSFVNLNWYHFY